jgi:hypothetical protein
MANQSTRQLTEYFSAVNAAGEPDAGRHETEARRR